MENEFRREVFVLKPTSKEEKEKGKLRVVGLVPTRRTRCIPLLLR